LFAPAGLASGINRYRGVARLLLAGTLVSGANVHPCHANGKAHGYTSDKLTTLGRNVSEQFDFRKLKFGAHFLQARNGGGGNLALNAEIESSGRAANSATKLRGTPVMKPHIPVLAALSVASVVAC
jgi:hypothetical protein